MRNGKSDLRYTVHCNFNTFMQSNVVEKNYKGRGQFLQLLKTQAEFFINVMGNHEITCA